MARRRRTEKARRHRITAEAQQAYEKGDWLLLHRALGLKPWEASPLDVERPEDAELRVGSAWARTVPDALQLRAELEEMTCRRQS